MKLERLLCLLLTIFLFLLVIPVQSSAQLSDLRGYGNETLAAFKTSSISPTPFITERSGAMGGLQFTVRDSTRDMFSNPAKYYGNLSSDRKLSEEMFSSENISQRNFRNVVLDSWNRTQFTTGFSYGFQRFDINYYIEVFFDEQEFNNPRYRNQTSLLYLS